MTYQLTQGVIESLVLSGSAVIRSVSSETIPNQGGVGDLSLVYVTVVGHTGNRWSGAITQREARRLQNACIPSVDKVFSTMDRVLDEACADAERVFQKRRHPDKHGDNALPKKPWWKFWT